MEPVDPRSNGSAWPSPAVGAPVRAPSASRQVELLPMMPWRVAGALALVSAFVLMGWQVWRLVDDRPWSLLGDLVIAAGDDLPGGSLELARGALELGLAGGSTEQAMLCARYLLEMGCDPANLPRDIPDVAAMIRLAEAASATPGGDAPAQASDEVRR